MDVLKRVLNSDTVSDQDKYLTCIKIFDMYEDRGEREHGMYYLVKSFKYDPKRAEGIYKLIVHYCCEGQNAIAYNYYSFIKDWFESEDYSLVGKPNVDQNVYDFFLPYYMIIVGERLGKHDLAIRMYKRIFSKKSKGLSSWFIKNLWFNLQFVIAKGDQELYTLGKTYVDFLKSEGHDVHTLDPVRKYDAYGMIEYPVEFSKHECRNSKNIMIYAGITDNVWGYTLSKTGAVGGAERAAIYLAECFPKDYTVYVCATLIEETHGNIKFVHRDKLPEIFKTTPFHTIIVSRFLAFFEQYHYSTYKLYMWCHDQWGLLNYGSSSSQTELFNRYQSKINNVICMTDWHKNDTAKKYPMIADKIKILNNGINLSLFPPLTRPKIPNSFVYTSCTDRGLARLLELWKYILNEYSDATLKICSYNKFPSSQHDEYLNKLIQSYPSSITHLGRLSPQELYSLLETTEYWFYPSSMPETSCITAMEMLKSRVLCLYYDIGGIRETIGDNGVIIKYGNEISVLTSLTPEVKQAILDKGEAFVNECSWEKRYAGWKRLLFGQKFTEEECKNSKTVLFYTGFCNPAWNFSYSINKALGGSETAVAYLAGCFPKDYKIYVTGQVIEETVGNVQYVYLDNIAKLVENTPIHTVIISRYLSFLEEYDYSAYQVFIWAHDTCLLPYGSKLTTHQLLEKWNDRINGCICLTEWHRQLFKPMYPTLANKIFLINNGIKEDLFMEVPKVKKTPNLFVYTSRSERGLSKLLDMWKSIKERIPDATLKISAYGDFPANPEEHRMNALIKADPSITHLGKLGASALYNLMASAEYWLYPTCWDETSCITALEMLRSGVICIYYPRAGLTNTMEDYGIPTKDGEELNAILSLTEEKKQQMRERGIQYAKSCSWASRYRIWSEMLFEPQIHVVNLERRADRKHKMIQKLADVQISNYKFIKACDGQQLVPSKDLHDFFGGNDFRYAVGVMGCAISHIELWQQLLDDPVNDYYVFFEDDIEFTPNFKQKLRYAFNEFRNRKMEHLLLGAFNTKTNNQHIANLEFLEYDTFKSDNEGTHCYIFSKSAAKKMIDYFRVTKLRYAIDRSLMYANAGVRTHIANENIVIAQTFQHTGYQPVFDSDVQHWKFMDTALMKEPIRKKIAFCDWWTEEYCGGTFDVNNNYLINLLREFVNVTVVNPTENPDIVIYSVFGKTAETLKNCRKVFYTGEPYPIRAAADYNITFDPTSPVNTRLPLWVCYMDKSLVTRNRTLPQPRDKFCSFVCSNGGKWNYRKDIVEKLSAYKRVDCAGTYLNNTGFTVPRGTNCSGKVEFNKQYKFSIVFENTKYPGYCTEKMCDAFKSGCIPIYWGDATLDFNPKCYIDADRFSSFDDLVEYVKKVDTDDALYASFFEEPIFTEYWMEKFEDPHKRFFKHVASEIIGEVLVL